MVDAAASLQSMQGPREMASTQARYSDTIDIAGQAGLAAYVEIASTGICSPAQHPLWIKQWVAEVQPDFLVATATRAGRPDFSMALEIVSKGPLRIARFMGGHHANGNMPAMTASFAKDATLEDMKAIIAAIGKARPDIDLIVLERLASDITNIRNPLLLLPHSQSPNLSLAVSLEGGFNAMLGRISGKRKSKKHRSQMRKFEAAGGFRRIEARTAVETDALLDAFFAMKEARFRKAGISNVFAEPKVQAFFRALFSDAVKEPKPPFVLHALEVAGKIRAFTASSRCLDRLVVEFGAISEDELAAASPGEFLFYCNIQEACEKGLSVYDFSVGDEPFKRLWCNLEFRQFDAFVPLSLKGRAFAAGLGGVSRVKGLVKNNRVLWRMVKRFRKKAAAPAEAPD